MAIHKLKTWPCYYQEIISGRKKFEVRYNDRNYQVGDRLDLFEYDPDAGEYTGAHCHVEVTYILDNSNPFISLGNTVIMSIKWAE
jgi:hypothetical protein